MHQAGMKLGFCVSCLENVLAYQFLLLHAFHEDYEEMLGLGPGIGEGLLNGDKQLVPQRFIDKSEIQKGALKILEPKC